MKENKLTALIAEDPVFALFLGACPAIAATRDVKSALGMSAAVLVVLLISTVVLGLIKKLVPAGARTPVTVLVTAGCAAAVQLLMQAFLPSAYQLLGVYVAVLAVNLLVFCVGERAGSRPFGAAVLDAVLTGLGFTAAALVAAAIRELLGAGSFAGLTVPFFETYNMPILRQATGGIAVFAIVLAVVNGVCRKKGQVGGFTAAAAGFADNGKEAE